MLNWVPRTFANALTGYMVEGMGWTAGSKGDAMWAGAWGTSFWIDPKEQLVGVLMAQAPSYRVPNRMLYKNLVYGAMKA